MCLCEWVGGGRGPRGPCFKRLATFQELNTSLEIHNGVKSTPATNYSMMNSAECCADGRRFFKVDLVGVEQVQRCLNCVGRKSHQDLLAHMRRVFASTSCSLPSIRLFLSATAQVFGHIPAMHTAAQPIERSSAIGLLQRYLIGLIWAQKRHSCKIGRLIKSRRHTSLHLLAFAGWSGRAKAFHQLYLQIKYLNCFHSETRELHDFLPNKRKCLWFTKGLLSKSPELSQGSLNPVWTLITY